MGFDRPIVEQFVQYMAHAARLDFGSSYLQHRPRWRSCSTPARDIRACVVAFILALIVALPVGFCRDAS